MPSRPRRLRENAWTEVKWEEARPIIVPNDSRVGRCVLHPANGVGKTSILFAMHHSRILRRSAVALASVAVRAHAQSAPPAREPIVTDRPDFTEATDAVGAHTFQLEAGNTFARTGDERSNALGEVLLRVGLARRVELRVSPNSYVRTSPATRAAGVPSAAGIEDASLGAKLALRTAPNGFAPAVAVLVGTSVPTGSRAFRHAAPEREAKLALSWELGERWDVATNVNYTASTEDDGTHVGEPAASVSVGHELTARVGSYFEVYGFRPRGGEGTQYVNTGLTFQLSPDFQLDARVGSGVGGNAHDYFGGLGLARRW